MKSVKVAVGVVERNDAYFICKRAAHQHQGGKWEFPGGKVEPNETSHQALVRELHEEIDIQVNSSSELLKIEHQYSDKTVLLDVLLVNDFAGEPHGKEGQEHRWVSLSSLADYEFPDANKAIIEHLQSR